MLNSITGENRSDCSDSSPDGYLQDSSSDSSTDIMQTGSTNLLPPLPDELVASYSCECVC